MKVTHHFRGIPRQISFPPCNKKLFTPSAQVEISKIRRQVQRFIFRALLMRVFHLLGYQPAPISHSLHSSVERAVTSAPHMDIERVA